MERKKQHSFFKTDKFWIAFTGIATFLLVLVAYFQLHESNEIAKKDKKINSERFLEDLKRDFLTKDSRDIFILIENDRLKFDSTNNTLGVFKKDTSIVLKEYFASISPDKKFYFSNEIDDNLLTHFEDLGKLYDRGLIDVEDIDQDFGYYIETCHTNFQIKTYINWVRKIAKDNSIYDKFDLLYDKLKLKD